MLFSLCYPLCMVVVAIVVVLDDLRSAHLVGFGQSAGDLYVDAVAQSCGHALLGISLLVAGAVDDIYIGVVALELNSTLGYGEHLVGLSQYDLCRGTVARAYLCAAEFVQGCLNLKLVGAVGLCSFW